ncbi:MAG: DNA-binding protein [Calditrichaeota bacterium]|nr:MAG: DNA-binding protein [Calditrichota bacterium]
MEKISIVSLRREKNKALETTAVLRARRRELGEDVFFNRVQNSSFFPLNYEEVSFEVVLTPEQKQILRSYLNHESENGHPGHYSGYDIHPLIFRFHIAAPQPEKTLTAEEVCEILHISRKTLYRYVKDGKIPCVRIGMQLRFFRQDIARYLEACKIASQPN